ncbi:MAG: hypothetical protein JWM88_3060, partial [Verrucomicrobia bacterium]|nr:hypothetical protein [Verrucomicrobiota bacterium]
MPSPESGRGFRTRRDFMNDSSPSTPADCGSRLGRCLSQVLLWLVMFLAILKLPAGPASGLDPSWRMVIGYAFDHGLQWGKDLVFT